MSYLYLVLFSMVFYYVIAQSVVTETKIDIKELRCLVCLQSIHELNKAVSKIDPRQKVDVGGYRLDADGNYKHKAVPQAKSELHLSEIIENICETMDGYIRALWKSNGTLTLFPMVTETGQMNPNMMDVDVIQDDDLNKSLKYYCEGIMEEHEENIIKLYQEETPNIKVQFCVKDTSICPPNKSINEEL
ncbi:hypothetical protein NQ314_008525 [Rhamnusium bicolor]|uniref:DUF3456 domain-containing protein n=1 Tax=Rhamnusium bicolor TaxID=1586634 RepID=A0AAV8YAC0_9CUCU|nr:hypothetical protein NQ314_008525 [Rhamnusium bicolor]